MNSSDGTRATERTLTIGFGFLAFVFPRGPGMWTGMTTDPNQVGEPSWEFRNWWRFAGSSSAQYII